MFRQAVLLVRTLSRQGPKGIMKHLSRQGPNSKRHVTPSGSGYCENWLGRGKKKRPYKLMQDLFNLGWRRLTLPP